MLLTFGPYHLEREPLTDGELDEIGLGHKFADRIALPFLEYVLNYRIESPIVGHELAGHFGWKGTGNVRMLRRYWWYLDVPVGSITTNLNPDKQEAERKHRRSFEQEEASKGYYWPRNAAEFKPTVDQYEGRFFAFCQTRPHLPICMATADELAAQLVGIKSQIIQTNLFTQRITEDLCKSTNWIPLA
jgi:hypothetical protein